MRIEADGKCPICGIVCSNRFACTNCYDLMSPEEQLEYREHDKVPERLWVEGVSRGTKAPFIFKCEEESYSIHYDSSTRELFTINKQGQIKIYEEVSCATINKYRASWSMNNKQFVENYIINKHKTKGETNETCGLGKTL